MTIKVRGLKELEKQLIALGSKDGTRILRRAMFLAGEPIEDRAKQRAAALPNGSGALEKSITRRVSGGPKQSFGFIPEIGSKFFVEIYPRAKDRIALALHNLFYKRKRKGIFYGHLLEFGHRVATSSTGRLKRSQRSVTRGVAQGDFSGLSAGTVAPRKIFEPALRAGTGRAIVIFARELRAGIERQLRKNSRVAR